MYFGDHPPPHVHLTGPGFKALIEVKSLKIIGHADTKTLAEAKIWIAANREIIMKFWQLRGIKR